LVFDAPDCKYDVIVGHNFMLPNNFDIKFSTQQMEWGDRVVPMKDARNPEFFCFHFDENADEEDPFDVFAADILPSKYDKVDVEAVVKQQEHLDAQQHTDLTAIHPMQRTGPGSSYCSLVTYVEWQRSGKVSGGAT
jgi:hypothetical protein